MYEELNFMCDKLMMFVLLSTHSFFRNEGHFVLTSFRGCRLRDQRHLQKPQSGPGHHEDGGQAERSQESCGPRQSETSYQKNLQRYRVDT